uniref:Uncharacterized protein n=1 Tax=Chromera velia CCMP2878 TaxID=1169474 RepID=A0A0G4FT30_9ALVE|eukprot:Cvel_18597.t1-p1 / transcript=Cvel_18597.t1 / gene=Cvel_18597 / organism=Chromera_velia_CCMP2878 / gene_product=Putative ankyrin repeat protein MM_0045, putative / transcript_product=Putative ankyrin repeat protein MM_0045, putative / location=Cvel_scaffold1551:38661-39176(-) / protein_length=172 / sequence_SO=supercontig / SO=protein_coding / is_pseudo=false
MDSFSSSPPEEGMTKIQLTKVILWHVRQFCPVSDRCFHLAVDKFVNEGKGDDLLLLLHLGADINRSLQHMAEYALQQAVERDCKRLLRYLISSGVDVNVEESYGRTVLMFACERGDVETVGILLKAGAKVNAGVSTALISACQYNHRETVEVLLHWGADVNRHRWETNTSNH